jgi:hypothetical protein
MYLPAERLALLSPENDWKTGQQAWHMSLYKGIMSYMRYHYYCGWFYNFDFHSIAYSEPFRVLLLLDVLPAGARPEHT